MKILSATTLALSLTVLTAHSTGCLADASEDDGELSVGIIGYSEPSIYTGGERSDNLLPYLAWESGNWFFRDYTLGSYLAGGDSWYLSAALGYDVFGDVNRGDSPQLKDMKELDPVYSAGVSAGLFGSLGYLSLSYWQDISDNHRGGATVLSYSLPVEAHRWTIEPHLSVTYAGSQAARYYLGVEADEARAGRPEYRPDQAYHYRAGINISRLFGRSHRVLFDLSHRRFSDEIEDSPIVDRNTTWAVSAGYVYEF